MYYAEIESLTLTYLYYEEYTMIFFPFYLLAENFLAENLLPSQ